MPEAQAPGGADGIRQGRLRRSMPMAGLATRTAGEAVVAALRRRAQGTSTEAFHLRTADRYAELLGRSKGALMKAGQMLSFVSFGNSVPAEVRTIYQAALSRLQADAPPMEPVLTRSVVEGDLGRPVEELFAEFTWSPLAAASIGQVHRARLADGRAVAVKVQYPGAAQAIRADLENTELLATFFSLIKSMVPGSIRLDPRAFAHEVGERITEELDYRREADNQSEFASLYAGHPFIHVPAVISDLSADHVLVQELVEGRRFSDATQADDELRQKWSEAIYRFCIGSLRRRGIFNADPHPGNYLFHDDGSVSFVDFGCVKRFSPEHLAVMNGMVRSAISGDAAAMWHWALEGGLITPDTPVSHQDVLSWWRGDFRDVLGRAAFSHHP